MAGRLYDGLGREFGFDALYKDVDSIPRGVDFRVHLEKAVGESRIVLVLIGKRWLTATDASGARRLDAETDLVRKEIEFAIARQLIIIPVLTDHASMPNEDQLPRSIRPIAQRNAAYLRPDPDFHRDLVRLVEDLGHLLPTSQSDFGATLRKVFSRFGTIGIIGIASVLLIIFAILGARWMVPKVDDKPSQGGNAVKPLVGETAEPDYLDDGFYSVELLVVKFVTETRTKDIVTTVRDEKTGVPSNITQQVTYTVQVPVTEKEQFQTRGFPLVKKFQKDGATYFKVTLRPSMDRTIILDVSQAPTSITKIESGRSPVSVAPPAIEDASIDDIFGSPN